MSSDYPPQGGGGYQQGGGQQQGGGYPQQQQGGYGQYPQQGGGYPPGYQQPRGNGLAVAGLVCGIVGILIASIILGPLALIFGGVGLSRANKGAPKKGMAIAAIVLGIIDIIIGVLVIAAFHGSFYFKTGS